MGEGMVDRGGDQLWGVGISDPGEDGGPARAVAIAMGLCVGSSAVPMQGTCAPSSCAYHWLESLACSGNVPLSVEWERIHSVDWLEALCTQSKLGKWINFCIDDLHEDTVVVASKVTSSASVEDTSGSGMAWDKRASASMGEAAVPMQAGPAGSGQALDGLVRLNWSVWQRWVYRYNRNAATTFHANARAWVLSVAEPNARRRRTAANSGGLMTTRVASQESCTPANRRPVAKWQSTRTRAQDAMFVAAAARCGSKARWETKEDRCEVEVTLVHANFFFFFFSTPRQVQQVEAPSAGATVKLPRR